MDTDQWKTEEYKKLTQESHNHFDYNMRVLAFTMGLVGVLLGLKKTDGVAAMAGLFVVLITSLMFFIGSFRKVFLIHAYIAEVLEEKREVSWHKLIPLLTKRHKILYETQNVAIMYSVVIIIYGILFFDTAPVLVTLASLILFALCVHLFFVPLNTNQYRATFRDFINKAYEQQPASFSEVAHQHYSRLIAESQSRVTGIIAAIWTYLKSKRL